MPSPLPKKKTDERLTDSNSPTPNTEGGMDFPLAMSLVISGKRVTKREWKNPEIVVYLDEHLKIKLADGSSHVLRVRDVDMLGTDWVEA